MKMMLGPIMCSLHGVLLTAEERTILQHPLIGGVILFTRNYESVTQISALVEAIHAVRDPPLLVAVDHEGGRVQRFQTTFTRLPAARTLGVLYQQDQNTAKKLAQQWGWLMAAELRAVGVDFSFAPVLDLDKKISNVIADRAIACDANTVSIQASAYMRGMKKAGMCAVGKHFPGHGTVSQDSHKAIPIDQRRIEDICTQDMLPFQKLIKKGIAGIMTAHILFPKVDQQLVSFSSVWLRDILRKKLQFSGVIFSDDTDMAAAAFAGDHTARIQAALDAGCDMVLICNNQTALLRILDTVPIKPRPKSAARLLQMQGRLLQKNIWQSEERKNIRALIARYKNKIKDIN